MKRKILSIIILVLFLFNSVCILSFAEVNGNSCGLNAIWRFSAGVLTISGTGEIYEFDNEEDYPWYSICNSINTLVISEGITNIPYRCFSEYYDNMKTVYIASTVSVMGEYALYNDEKLESIYFYGNAPSFPGKGISFNSNEVIYYVSGKTGWTDSDVYDISTGEWNYHILREWNPYTHSICIGNFEAKSGNIIEIPVNLGDTTAFSNLSLEIGYNSNVMNLTGVKSNVVGTSFTTAQSITKNPYNMQWDSASNVSHNGTLAILTFKVKDDAKSGEYPITVDFYKGRNGTNIDGDSVNYKTSDTDKTEFEPIGLSYESGIIKITNDDTPILNNVTVTVGTTSGEPGDLVEIPITLSEELSFSNLSLEVGYDSDVMTLTGVNNSVLDGAFTTAQEMTKNPYNMQWDSANNVSASGKIVTLTFRIKRNATSGTYPVTVSFYKGRNGDNVDGYSINYTDSDIPLNLSYVNGSVAVKENQGGNTPSIGVSGISFMVNLSADSYMGSIYAGLYDDNGRLVSVKQYPADENVFVSFDKGKTGAYVKIMWWDDNMSPMCEAQILPIH